PTAPTHPPERPGSPGPETLTNSKLEENPSQAVASTQNFGYRSQRRRSAVTVTSPAEEGTVTRASLREYATVQRERYQHATHGEKGRLLDEIVAVTGGHSVAAARGAGVARGAPRGPAADSSWETFNDRWRSAERGP